MNRMLRLAALAVTLPAGMLPGTGAAQGPAATAVAPPGTTIAVGNGVRDDLHAVWSRIVAAAGGPGARIVVFSASSGQPDRAAGQIIAALEAHGARAEHIRIGPLIPGSDPVAAVRDPAWIARVDAATGVFFSGGRQDHLLDLLLPDGRSTPLLDAVRGVWARGGVVAGESAGAAVMSRIAFREMPSPLLAMKGRLDAGRETGPGLGFLPEGVVVDQHFLARGRIGRLLPLMVKLAQPLGLGVEENSAAVVRGDEVEVIGEQGVVVIDLARARVPEGLSAFGVQDARLSLLHAGDRFDLRTRRITPAAARAAAPVERSAPGFSGRIEGPGFFPDLLGPGVLAQAMAQAVDGQLAEVLGLSFAGQPEADDPAPDLGFEWRFKADAASRGWGGARGVYTLAQVRLDVRPVRMARPLYTPWHAAPDR